MNVLYTDEAQNSPRDGFELTGEVSDSVPRTSMDAPDNQLSSMSLVDANEQELLHIMENAEKTNPEYAMIVRNATSVEDVSADVWGALIFLVVHDLPDMRAGRMNLEGRVRAYYVFFVFICNLFIQGILLYFIIKLLMMPSVLDTQNIYLEFHSKAFSNAKLDHVKFEDFPGNLKASLCGLALSQLMFVRIILFLWVTSNVGELRDTFTKMIGALTIPALPEGLDTRLMKRDLEASERDDNIICLNLKGKVGLTILVFVPKIAIASVLMITGCVWLMAAENIGDLILNSLALAFVVKVDELLADVFFPRHYLDMVGDLAFVLPARVAEDKDEAMQQRAWEFIWCAVTMLGTMAAVEMIIIFQPVLPRYEYDVHASCMNYLNNQVPWCLPWQSDCFPVSGQEL